MQSPLVLTKGIKGHPAGLELHKKAKYEASCLPHLEAMACGCSVLGSDISSVPKVVGEAAIKVTLHDMEELAVALEKILADRELGKTLFSGEQNRLPGPRGSKQQKRRSTLMKR